MMTYSTNYIAFDGVYYAIDIDALSRYIIGTDDEKVIEQTKSEQWIASETSPSDMSLMTKEITESSSMRKDEHAPFRAEIAKMMLTLIMYPSVGEDGGGKDITTFSGANLTFGQTISFNTCIEEGIIKEIQVEDDEETNE